MDIDLTQFTDPELAIMQAAARAAGEVDWLHAILIELSERDRARSSAETESA